MATNDLAGHVAVFSGAELEEKCVDLRVRSYSYRRIAKELGCSVSTAFDHVQHALAQTIERTTLKAEHLRELELEKLDAQEATTTKVLEDAEDDRMRLLAIDRLQKIGDRRARLLGLNAPVEIAGKGGGPVQVAIEYPDNNPSV